MILHGKTTEIRNKNKKNQKLITTHVFIKNIYIKKIPTITIYPPINEYTPDAVAVCRPL